MPLHKFEIDDKIRPILFYVNEINDTIQFFCPKKREIYDQKYPIENIIKKFGSSPRNCMNEFIKKNYKFHPDYLNKFKLINSHDEDEPKKKKIKKGKEEKEEETEITIEDFPPEVFVEYIAPNLSLNDLLVTALTNKRVRSYLLIYILSNYRIDFPFFLNESEGWKTKIFEDFMITPEMIQHLSVERHFSLFDIHMFPNLKSLTIFFYEKVNELKLDSIIGKKLKELDLTYEFDEGLTLKLTHIQEEELYSNFIQINVLKLKGTIKIDYIPKTVTFLKLEGGIIIGNDKNDVIILPGLKTLEIDLEIEQTWVLPSSIEIFRNFSQIYIPITIDKFSLGNLKEIDIKRDENMIFSNEFFPKNLKILRLLHNISVDFDIEDLDILEELVFYDFCSDIILPKNLKKFKSKELSGYILLNDALEYFEISGGYDPDDINEILSFPKSLRFLKISIFPIKFKVEEGLTTLKLGGKKNLLKNLIAPLPSSLKILNVKRIFSDFGPFTQPHFRIFKDQINLTELKIKDLTFELNNEIYFPESLLHLDLYIKFLDHSKLILPKNLEFLKLNSILIKDSTYKYFKNFFFENTLSLPFSLKEFHMDPNFNGKTNPSSLKELKSLEVLIMGRDFNQNIELPDSLKILKIGEKFDKSIILPPYLKQLTLNSPNILKNNQKKLHYEEEYLTFPITLYKLNLGYEVNFPLILPERLEIFIMGTKFNQKVKIPNGLIKLYMGRDFNQDLNIPLSLRLLVIGKSFNKNLTGHFHLKFLYDHTNTYDILKKYTYPWN